MQNEKVIENKVCKKCNSSFEITDRDLEFYEKVSPVFNGVRYNIPIPTLCPNCRQQRRLSFRNERTLYKRLCDATGKQIISMYSPDKSYKVYDFTIWKSDIWNALEYGIDFDFSKTFFEQLSNLNDLVPKNSIYNGSSSENSDYNNFVGNMKDCYLVFDSMDSRNCYYCTKTSFSNNCIDCEYVFNSENCYELEHGNNCFGVFFASHCRSCTNSYFLYNCNGCSNCFGCSNLKNQQYYIFNKKYTKEEYTIELRKLINSLNPNKIKEYCTNLATQYSYNKNSFIIGSDNCTGYNIENSNNCIECYDALNQNNSKFCNSVESSENCYDLYSWGDRSSLIYEGIGLGTKSHKLCFNVCCWSACTNLIYNFFLNGCNDCFGCVGLRNKSYCIFNKQYTKEEYNELVPKIIDHMKKTGEWGEFFPASISPFGYNETLAGEFYPLSKDIAIKENFKWSDYETPFPKVDKVIPAKKLPNNISDIPNDILNRAIECEITKKPFRIISQELEFYRKHHLPIPKRHPEQRHLDRMALRNSRKFV